MPVNSPNMGLPIPIIGVDSGLTWEQSLAQALTIIDAHMHAPNYGVLVTPSGLNINTALTFNGNDAFALRSSRYVVQNSPISNASDIGCTYVSGADLWYNDTAGNQIQITSGGAVNATASGIKSGNATASFVSSVLVVNAASNTPANIAAGSILLGNNSLNSNYVTLSPPASIPSDVTQTLPTIPSATSFMQMDTSGNMSATTAVSQGITRSNQAPVGQQISSSSGSFSSGSTSITAVTNLSVTLTTSGRPVMVFCQSDGTGNNSFFGGNNSGTAYNVYIYRGATQLSNVEFLEGNSPPSTALALDTPSAGTYTYTVQVQTSVHLNDINVNNMVLVAYEL